MIGRIKKLLDSTSAPSAVSAAQADWATAFHLVDPTSAILKFIKIGRRPALIPILVSYLTDRKMKVKYKNKTSNQSDL